MTQKDKELLLKDLCGRLPYGVICQIYDPQQDYGEDIFDARLIHIDAWTSHCYFWGCSETDPYKIEQVKPYLRPMSSMTKEEKLHVELTYGFFYHDGVLDNVHIFEAGGTYDRDGNYEPPCEYRQEKHVTIEQVLDFIHWLNEHYFDYRGLIEKGLALEAPEGMYN